MSGSRVWSWIDPLTKSVRQWAQLRSLRSELGTFTRDEVAQMARDAGLTDNGLESILRGHPGPGTLLPRRLARLRLDPADLQATRPELFRILRTECASCGSWRRCRRDLADKAPGPAWRDYCLNADQLQGLATEARRRRTDQKRQSYTYL